MAHHRLIFAHDGGSIAPPDFFGQLAAESLVEAALGPLAGSQIDTFFWQLGTDPYLASSNSRLSDWYCHATDVAARWGRDIPSFRTAGEWRLADNASRLIDNGDDPPAILIEHGHAMGLSMFLSARVNDGHDHRLPPDDMYLAPIRREHPEWRINGEGWERYVLNFALEPVQDYRLSLALEAIDRYDLDGFDWDFCRYPPFFLPGEEAANLHVFTDLLARLREALDAKGKRCGRRLELAVRVPAPWDRALDDGLDIAAWIDQELIDILVIGHPRERVYRLPIEPYVEAARGKPVQVVAQGLGCYRWHPRASHRVLFEDYGEFPKEMCRAFAANYYEAGATGIYLWNNQFIKHYHRNSYEGHPWHELHDPDSLARLDKHYVHRTGPEGAPLPAELGTFETRFDVADDLPARREEGLKPKAVLRLCIEQLTPLDEVEILLNGSPLAIEEAELRMNYNDCWLDFELADDALRPGWNDLRASALARNPQVSYPLLLCAIETLITYGDSAEG